MRIAVAVMTCALGFGIAPASEPTRDDSASEKLGIKLSMQCYTFRKRTFFETVDETAKLGIRYLEIYPGQLLKPGSAEKMNLPMSDAVMVEVTKKLADAGGLKLVGYGVAPIPNDEKSARVIYEHAKKLGISVLVTESEPTDLHEKLCSEFNIRFAIHNHPGTWPPEKVLAATRARSPLMGSCSDTGHWMADNLIPVATLKALQGRVLHSHFKDRGAVGKSRDVVYGTGIADVQGMLKELKRQGFHGYLSVEYEYGDSQHLAENLPKCVEFFDKVMRDLAK